MHALIGALVLLAATPAAAEPPRSFAGLYQINQMEMAGGLELSPDGRFRYALEYGAVSEQGAGKWSFDGTDVRLTSDPMPKPPTFELLKDDPAPKGELYVTLAPPGFGSWTGRLSVALLDERAGRNGIVEASDEGKVPLPGWWPTSVSLVVPIYSNIGPPTPISAKTGHRLQFRFLPNDLGKVRFNNVPLAVDGDTLILDRYETMIVFKPVQPRPR